MFDYKHYVPIIRWKAGERIALRELYDDDKAGLTPLIEIPPDSVEKALKKKTSLAEFASQLRVQILDCWGRQPAFLDISHLTARVDPNQRFAFTEQFYKQANAIGLSPLPVVGLGGASPASTHNRITSFESSMCLRVGRGDLVSGGLTRKISNWISIHETDASKVHLVLDLRILDSSDQGYLQFYSNIPLLDEWNTVTIVGGSFPKDLQEFPVGEHLLPRTEWDYWKQLVRGRLVRTPTFGDYATLHPYLQTPFPGMNVSASIRYTTDDHWLVMRGEGLLNKDGAGHAQYPANAQMLIERPEFCGRDFSFGDNYIYERPVKSDQPGIPMNWVTVGVNHHLTFVVRQIERLFELPPRPQRYRQIDIGLPFVADASATGDPLSPKPTKSPLKKPI
jgi:hypothetical protein